MAQRGPSRNGPCPCGSGKKFKHCCLGKGFDWLEDQHGRPSRNVPLSAEVAALLDRQRQRFRQHFGREPGPDDLLFFDAPAPEQLEHQIAQAMRQGGLDPAMIHAFEQTGLLVSEENRHLIPQKDLEAWEAAVADYRRRHEPPGYPLGTLACYGPDDRATTKVVAAVFAAPGAEPVLRRWVSSRALQDPRIQEEIRDFLKEHGVRQVAATEGNMGCPHEEGEDFPLGGDCPFCPFWRGKQGSNRRDG
jgi:hypothetical protein